MGPFNVLETSSTGSSESMESMDTRAATVGSVLGSVSDRGHHGHHDGWKPLKAMDFAVDFSESSWPMNYSVITSMIIITVIT